MGRLEGEKLAADPARRAGAASGRLCLDVFFNFKVHVYAEQSVHDADAHSRVPGREITP